MSIATSIGSGSGQELLMTGQVERNKQTVMAFYDLMFNQGKPREAIEMF